MKTNGTKKKLFNRHSLTAAGVAYILYAAAFIYGYSLGPTGGIITFGPMFSAFFTLIVVSPFIVFIGFAAVWVWRKSILPALGFLIMACAIWVALGAWGLMAHGIHIHSERERLARREASLQERAEFSEANLGPVVREVYPNAEFVHFRAGVITERTTIRLRGFSWENQPDFDAEKEVWRNLVQNEAIIQYSHPINVEYFFDGEYLRSFATLRLSDFRFWFSHSGITEAGLKQVEALLAEYLSGYNDAFKIVNSFHALSVVIYREVEPEDEASETIRWQHFLDDNGINTEIAMITVFYQLPRHYLSPEEGFIGSPRSVHLDTWDWINNFYIY